jgi:acetylornithine deacetylase/succinyl-diaminopimelate desuccinylase-like protein
MTAAGKCRELVLELLRMENVLAHLRSHQPAAIEQLCEFLRIPSVSADSKFAPEMQRCATWVRDFLTNAGVQARLCETAGHPIVYGERLQDPALPTILVYGHYDVQPPDPLNLWTTPAFEPQIRAGRLYARGATDDKGQLFTHLKSLEAWIRVTGRLPVNIKVLIEGEEEVGGANLEHFLNAHRELLKADVAVISDTSQFGDGIPAITCGLRGIVAAEVRLTGPSRDLHSGIYGGSIANPVNALARICGALVGEDGRIQIPGFYDDVVELTVEERTQSAGLPFSESGFLAETGSAATFGEAGWTTLERRTARPTCDINGIAGGYSGEGPKTIIPSRAMAKITCRLVPDMRPEKVFDSLEQFLKSRLPAGVQFEFIRVHGCEAFVFDPTSQWLTAARRAVATAFGQPPVLIREGGSIPVVLSFKQILGLDTLLLGWGRNTDNLHSPDEHIHVEDFHRGTLASACLWAELAKVRS